MKEWRGVLVQLANLAAIVYLATHAADNDIVKVALGAIAATNATAHMRARYDAGSGYGGGGGLGNAAGILTGVQGSSLSPPVSRRLALALSQLVFYSSVGMLAYLGGIEIL